MPCWSIHLAIAKRINKELNYNKNVFYFANIIPDINPNEKFNRYDAHYYGTLKCEGCEAEELPDLNRFLKDYKKDLKDPLICGYYCHILSDYYYNREIYTRCYIQNKNNEIIGIRTVRGKIIKIDNDSTGQIRANYKHKDLESYGKTLFKDNRVEFPIYDKDIMKSTPKLISNILDEVMIKKIINEMTIRLTKWNSLTVKEKIFGIKYIMLNKKDLDLLYEGCIEFIKNELIKNKVIEN